MPINILSPIQLPSGAASGRVLTSDASGGATWQPYTPKRAIVRRNASMTVANNALTFPVFDTEVEDNDAMFTPSSANVTIKTAGLYLINGSMGWPLGAMTRVVTGIFYTPSGGAGVTMA
jgi:hypothetical protein